MTGKYLALFLHIIVSRELLIPRFFAARYFVTSPLSIASMVCWATSRLSFFHFLGFFEESCGSSQRPALTECCTFSLGETHSRLLGRLSDRSKLTWFTCVFPSAGEGRKAIATSLCTRLGSKVRIPFTLRAYRQTLEYPSTTLSRSTRPLIALVLPQREGTTRSRLLTLPRLLTSYRPSNPTTGFQDSLSISHLSSGICSLFSGVAARATSVFSEIAQWPFVSARQEPRPVGQPRLGVSPA